MDTTTEEVPVDDVARSIEKDPSDFYDGATTTEEVTARSRDAWAIAADIHGDVHAVPRAERDRLSEDARRAYWRVIHGPKRARGEKRETFLHEARPVENGDGSMSLTCRVCEQTMDPKKFPTLSGRPGVRGDVCRACVKARTK